MPFNCWYTDGFSHFDTLVLETVVPVVVFGFSCMTNFTYRALKPASWSYIKFRTLVSYAIQIVFLVLPTISRRIGQSLQACTTYDAGSHQLRFLAADHTISCEASNGYYKTMFVFATIMLLVVSSDTTARTKTPLNPSPPQRSTRSACRRACWS